MAPARKANFRFHRSRSLKHRVSLPRFTPERLEEIKSLYQNPNNGSVRKPTNQLVDEEGFAIRYD